MMQVIRLPATMNRSAMRSLAALLILLTASWTAAAPHITDIRTYGPNAHFEMTVNKVVNINGVPTEVQVCQKTHVQTGFIPPATFIYEAVADASDGIQAGTWYHVYVIQYSGGTPYSVWDGWIQPSP